MDLSNWGVPYLFGFFWLAVPLVVVWSMAWKGMALWKAGRNEHLIWFIVLFIFNPLGILPIIYIFAFSRISPEGKEKGFIRSKRRQFSLISALQPQFPAFWAP